MFTIKRSPHNPLISPNKDLPWQAIATFNGSPVLLGEKIACLYRALSLPVGLEDGAPSISTIGKAISSSGENFGDHEKFIFPEKDFEKFGCEDPRVIFFEGKYYIFYTAISEYPFKPEGIKVAVATSKDLEKIDEKHLVTFFNAKAMVLFPKRINGKIFGMLTVHSDLPPAQISLISFEKESDIWSPEYWGKWYLEFNKHALDLKRKNTDHIEIGAPPLETPHGWLLIYSHIQNYFSAEKVFGIEAVLLDLKDPRKIIGRTEYPMLVPEEIYEKYGIVPNITFPSGAFIKGKKLHIYYGGADTVTCEATVDLEDLLEAMRNKPKKKYVARYSGNPIISPRKENVWENIATFNPGAIDLDGKVRLLYRAMGKDATSVMGYAESKDGKKIDLRLPEPVYVPREDFEKKGRPGNSGCEDARLVKIGKDIYMFYTAYDNLEPPKVAVTSIKEKDFLAKKWKWTKPIVMTPKGIDDKDTCLFPEKVGDKYMVFHRVSHHICADFINSLNFEKEKVTKCIQIIGPRPGMWDSKKVGISSPPFKTEKGWVLLYHGISEEGVYNVGAALLDKDDPTRVIARTGSPIIKPEERYEKEGIVPEVVFPCGTVIRKGTLFIYYGGADQVVGVATMKLEDLLKMLT